MLVHHHAAATSVGHTEEIMTGMASAIFTAVGIIVRCVPCAGCQQDLKFQQSNYVCFVLTCRKSVSTYVNAPKIITPTISVTYLARRKFTAFEDMLHDLFYFPNSAVYFTILSFCVQITPPCPLPNKK
jgi:hypothetical protein